MYQQTKTKGRAIRPSLQIAILKLFLLFAAFGNFACSRLRLCFFHRFLGVGGTLGTGLGTLLPLFFLQFLAAQQFDERLLSAVALLPSCTENPLWFSEKWPVYSLATNHRVLELVIRTVSRCRQNLV